MRLSKSLLSVFLVATLVGCSTSTDGGQTSTGMKAGT